MIIISARSPYQIVIDETDQIGTKVELFVWNKGTTEPVVPTYVMSEKIASITQRETNYNISPFILEHINQIYVGTAPFPIVAEDNSNWCFVKVKTYFTTNGLDYTLIDTLDYYAVNGYTLAEDGVNYDIVNSNVFCLLAEDDITVQYYNSNAYYNFMCQRSVTNAYTVDYFVNGVSQGVETILSTGTAEIFNLKVPVSKNSSDTFSIFRGATKIYEVKTDKILECKYDPIDVVFVNRYGGWQFLTFFKASQQSIETKGTDYNLMPSSWNYNYRQGQSKSMNLNGIKTIKCNTGFVDEDYQELITDLMLSDIVLVDGFPATVKSKSTTLKTHLRDKNINYTVDFEFANNLVNNIV
jgi:hypothetical protein